MDNRIFKIILVTAVISMGVTLGITYYFIAPLIFEKERILASYKESEPQKCEPIKVKVVEHCTKLLLGTKVTNGKITPTWRVSLLDGDIKEGVILGGSDKYLIFIDINKKYQVIESAEIWELKSLK